MLKADGPNRPFVCESSSAAMNKSQRASETQSRKLQNSIANIRKEISPVPTVSSIGSNPRALPLTKTRWLRRTVRITNGFTYVKLGEAMGALTGEVYSVKILGIKAWNVTGQATSTSSILCTVDKSALLGPNTAVAGEDYGTASNLAGVKINIPDLLANTNLTSSTENFCFCSAPNVGGTQTQYYCLDVSIMYQM